jgi:hypothetical protein
VPSPEPQRHGKWTFGLVGVMAAAAIVVVFLCVAVPNLRANVGTTVLDENLRTLMTEVNSDILDGADLVYRPSTEDANATGLSLQLEQSLRQSARSGRGGYTNPCVVAPNNRVVLNSESVDPATFPVPPAVLITNAATLDYDGLSAKSCESLRRHLAGSLIVQFDQQEACVEIYYVTKQGERSTTVFRLHSS